MFTIYCFEAGENNKIKLDVKRKTKIHLKVAVW